MTCAVNKGTELSKSQVLAHHAVDIHVQAVCVVHSQLLSSIFIALLTYLRDHEMIKYFKWFLQLFKVCEKSEVYPDLV